MDRIATEAAIKTFLLEIRQRLDEAASLAKAAEVCVRDRRQGGEVALNIWPMKLPDCSTL